MKTLILVAGCRREPWASLIAKQKQTWGAWKHPEVEQAWYMPGPVENPSDDTIIVDSPDEIDYMPMMLRGAITSVWDRPWDFLFRTNTSSYVCKRCLHNKALTLPKEKCYCGMEGPISFLPDKYKGATHASGCGFFLSRDAAEVLMSWLPDTAGSFVEDGMVGVVLWQRGISVTPGAQRCQVYPELSLFDTYHYRCRSEDGDRTKDERAMEFVDAYKRGLQSILYHDE